MRECVWAGKREGVRAGGREEVIERESVREQMRRLSLFLPPFLLFICSPPPPSWRALIRRVRQHARELQSVLHMFCSVRVAVCVSHVLQSALQSVLQGANKASASACELAHLR